MQCSITDETDKTQSKLHARRLERLKQKTEGEIYIQDEHLQVKLDNNGSISYNFMSMI